MPNTTTTCVLAVIAVAVAFGAVPARAQDPQWPSDDPDLRGQWHLDTGHTQDDAVSFTPDSSGNGLDAVVRYSTAVDGRFDKAFHYEGASLTQVYVCCNAQNSSPLLRPAQLTTLAWVRRTGTPGPYRYVVAQGSGSACASSAYALYTGVDRGMGFYVTSGSTAYHAPSVAPSEVWDGNWHMVAGTFDGSFAHFFFDGHEVGSGTPVPGAINYSQEQTHFRIGRYASFLSEPCADVTSFNGDIDEVRVYGSALTGSQIAALASETWTTPPPAGAAPPPPPPPPPPDTTPPTTTITLGPPEPNAAMDYYPDEAGVLVTASDESAVETRCVIDPQVAPATFDDLPTRCDFTSPLTVIQQGRHTVYAASRDSAGNVEHPVAKRAFRVLRTPRTTIVEGPEGPTWIRNPLFTFVTPLAGSTFECRIDDRPWSRCSSPFQSPPLAAGPHTFSVRATSPEGAIEVTPASRTFSINETVREEADCTVRPVLWWFMGWRPVLQSNGQYACFIGRLPSSGCPREHTCTPRELVCPSGARCTLTTRAAWNDADERIRQGAHGLSQVGLPSFGDDIGGPAPNVAQPYQRSSCLTGLDDSRCAVVTRLSVIGDDRPLSGSCGYTLDWFGGFGLGVAWGPDEDRILRCSVSMTTAPATPLLGMANNASLLLSTPTAGELIASWIVADGSSTARTAADRPRIKRSRVTVRRAKAVRLVPRLNPAARKQLRRTKKLAVSVRLKFTPKGGGPVIRRQRVTLRRPARPLRLCEVSKPKPTRPVRSC